MKHERCQWRAHTLARLCCVKTHERSPSRPRLACARNWLPGFGRLQGCYCRCCWRYCGESWLMNCASNHYRNYLHWSDENTLSGNDRHYLKHAGNCTVHEHYQRSSDVEVWLQNWALLHMISQSENLGFLSRPLYYCLLSRRTVCLRHVTWWHGHLV